MAEAEKIADRVAILLRGKITATGTSRDLITSSAGLIGIAALRCRSRLVVVIKNWS